MKLQPININFRKNLADLLYIACGETEEALKLYVKVLDTNPRDIETLKAISHICIEAGNFDDARSFLENILKIEPWNRDARESIAHLQESISKNQLTPDDQRTPDQIHGEAVKLANENKLSEAQAILEALVNKHPEHALAQNDLGVLRYRSGDRDGARHAYERAVALQPASANFSKNLADLYFTELGMTDEAIHIYLELLKNFPRDVEILIALGQITSAVGHPDEAKSFYRRALEIEPWNRDARKLLQELA